MGASSTKFTKNNSKRLCLLGTGSYGKVWKVKMKRINGKFFAMKSIKLNMDDGIKNSVINELNILKSLDHENVIKYVGVDYQQKEDMVYIFLELADQEEFNDM